MSRSSSPSLGPGGVAAHVDTCLAHAESGLADDMDADEDTPQDVDIGNGDVDLCEESE